MMRAKPKPEAVFRRTAGPESLPIFARKYHAEIVRIEADLDEVNPGWDRTSGRSLKGSAGLDPGSEAHTCAKTLLCRRAWLIQGQDLEPVVSTCARTGRVVIIPHRAR